MSEPRYFDIIRVKTGEKTAPGFRQRIKQKFQKQKKILALRWEFLDLSLSGVLVYGLVVIMAFGSAVLTTRIISANFNKKPELQIAPTFSDFKVETQAPSPQKPKPSPDASQKTTPQSKDNNPFEFIKKSELKPAKDSFNIRILNGNGRAGEAGAMKTKLKDGGFKVNAIGNARHRYSKTQIYYLAGKEAEAKLTAENLGRESEIHEADSSLIGNGYDILIVLGIK